MEQLNALDQRPVFVPKPNPNGINKISSKRHNPERPFNEMVESRSAEWNPLLRTKSTKNAKGKARNQIKPICSSTADKYHL